MNRVLREIEGKIDIVRPKKYSALPPKERSSVLRICRYIGDIIGYDSIRVESIDSDIEFEDREAYFLEVKTPIYFRGNHGDNHLRIMKEFNDILESRRSRFVSGFIDNKNNLEVISDFKRRNIKNTDSTGNLMFEYTYISDKFIYRKLRDLIFDAADQLDKIDSTGRKIIVIDISYLLLDSLRPREQLQNWLELNPEISERVDGICIFSLDHQKKGGLIYPLTISTQRLKDCVKSNVFKQIKPQTDIRYNLQTIFNKKFDERSTFMDFSGKVHVNDEYLKDLYNSSLKLRKQDENISKEEGIDRIGIYFNNKSKKSKIY